MDLNEFLPLLDKLKVQNVQPLIIISKIFIGMYNRAIIVVLYFLGILTPSCNRGYRVFLHR